MCVCVYTHTYTYQTKDTEAVKREKIEERGTLVSSFVYAKQHVRICTTNLYMHNKITPLYKHKNKQIVY